MARATKRVKWSGVAALNTRERRLASSLTSRHAYFGDEDVRHIFARHSQSDGRLTAEK